MQKIAQITIHIIIWKLVHSSARHQGWAAVFVLHKGKLSSTCRVSMILRMCTVWTRKLFAHDFLWHCDDSMSLPAQTILWFYGVSQILKVRKESALHQWFKFDISMTCFILKVGHWQNIATYKCAYRQSYVILTLGRAFFSRILWQLGSKSVLMVEGDETLSWWPC